MELQHRSVLDREPEVVDVRDAHVYIGWVIIGTNALAGLWAFGAHHKDFLCRRQLWWFIWAAQLLIFVQATLGVTIQSSDELERNDFHLLYGFSMVIASGILYSYRAQMPQHRLLLYAGGSLFIMGLGIRSAIL